ncbi:MAG: hypothetical protein PHX87_00745 [Candidatus Peribacteraceae bacterium]|nr:hypothetical protein [Candidatus Peribacteraceae bacterium]MDD5741936.1 hypothetical protein [Candidatus Peribacteraceae bacterium]
MPEHDRETGVSDPSQSPLRTEMESIANRAEQTADHFLRATHFASLMHDPLMQKLMETHGADSVLQTLRDGRAHGKTFLQVIGSFGMDTVKAEILCADFVFETLTAADFSDFMGQLQENHGSADAWEESMKHQTELSLITLGKAAHELLRRIDAAEQSRSAQRAPQCPKNQNGKDESLPLTLAHEARTRFQHLCLLPADPESTDHLHYIRRKNHNNHHGARRKQ